MEAANSYSLKDQERGMQTHKEKHLLHLPGARLFLTMLVVLLDHGPKETMSQQIGSKMPKR